MSAIMKMIFIMLSVLTCLYSYVEAGCKMCEKRKNPPIEIHSLPYVITQPGKYMLRPYYALYPQGIHKALISVQSDNVWIDLRGNTLHLEGRDTAGILIDGKKNVHIMNGSFFNANAPLSLESDTLMPPHPTPNLSSSVDELMAFASGQFADPVHACVGVAVMSGSSNIRMQNLVFNQLYIGIAGIDDIHHVEITHCQGINCGHCADISNLGRSSFRGGFIVIAPTQPTHVPISSNITLRSCKVISPAGFAGIALCNSKNSSAKYCLLETSSSDIYTNALSGLVAIFCHDSLFQYITNTHEHSCTHLYTCKNCYWEE